MNNHCQDLTLGNFIFRLDYVVQLRVIQSYKTRSHQTGEERYR